MEVIFVQSAVVAVIGIMPEARQIGIGLLKMKLGVKMISTAGTVGDTTKISRAVLTKHVNIMVYMRMMIIVAMALF